MKNTLANNSNIIILKWKFFLFRIVSYFSFLMFPIYLQKGLILPHWLLMLLMTFYVLFVVSQWFLLGKEIDHRFKIYFRVNSSIDRVVYRLFLGMFFFILLFNLISYFSSKWIYNSYWIVWVLLGLFYSWPTRGKIIQESMTSHFGEFKFLDRFEKTLVGMIVVLFIFSITKIPPVSSIDMLKLYLDPLEKIANPFWNFLTVNYYPFKAHAELFSLAWGLHFYIVGMGLFLVVFYALLRFFLSRRLSLLGVFGLLSAWGYSKILMGNYDAALLSTYSLLWIWTLLWVTKSLTYRSGLFLGLVSFWGVLLNKNFGFLVIPQMLLIYFVFLKDRSHWYKLQLFRYAAFGLGLTVIYMISHTDGLLPSFNLNYQIFDHITLEVRRKGFLILSYIGVLILLVRHFYGERLKTIKDFKMDEQNLWILVCSLLVFIVTSFFTESFFFRDFSILWALTFFSLIPLELLFQSLSRQRSKRNMIYLIYILICLLDSHFEGRVKIFLNLLNL